MTATTHDFRPDPAEYAIDQYRSMRAVHRAIDIVLGDREDVIAWLDRAIAAESGTTSRAPTADEYRRANGLGEGEE